MINIQHGDCFDLMRGIPKESIDLIICDLPYGISRDSGFASGVLDKYTGISLNFGEWDTKEINLGMLSLEYYRLLKDSGVVIIFYDIWAATAVKEGFNNFNQPRVMCWVKDNPVPINSHINILSNASEYLFSFIKGSKPTFNAEYHKGIFNHPICHGNERTQHPTQKPLKLIEELVKLYSVEGDTVLDSCAGSGTTGVACENLNRECILIEKDAEYIKIIESRCNRSPEERRLDMLRSL